MARSMSRRELSQSAEQVRSLLFMFGSLTITYIWLCPQEDLEQLIRLWDHKQVSGASDAIAPGARIGSEMAGAVGVGGEELEGPDGQQETQQCSSTDRLLALKHAEVRGWFLGAKLGDIRRGNVEEWVAWAFHNTTPTQLSEQVRARLFLCLCL